ncbi:MAG: universal stress protein [Dehalococcoidia bacterium]
MERTSVLVPLDGSLLSAAALPYAETIARATGAQLRLLAVVEHEPDGPRSQPAEVRAHLERARMEGMTHELHAIAAKYRERGLIAATEVVLGDPVDEILAAADLKDVRMTVMATHGRGGFQRMMMGSVADKVMRLNAHPTLLVRTDEQVVPEPVSLVRVMVPLDGSSLAEAALPMAIDLARACSAAIVLVRVQPFATPLWMPDSTPEAAEEVDAAIAAAAESYLGTIRGEIPPAIRTQTVVLRGSPLLRLTEFVAEADIDLVVMTTHGRHGFRRMVLGSVADRMVRGGVPVLLVRPQSPTTALAQESALHCANCGRLVTAVPIDEARCPRCEMHLHRCANCLYWDTTGCILQRAEAFTPIWPGRGCPRFTFRQTPTPAGQPRLIEADVKEVR